MSKAQVRAKVCALHSVDPGFADPDKALHFFAGVWNLTSISESDDAHYLRGTGTFHHILATHRLAQPVLIGIVLGFTADGRRLDEWR